MGGRTSASHVRRRRLAGIAAPATLVLLLSAHVGTDDTFFAGRAGPYDVRVMVRQPGVIPGLADITVRTAERGIDRVLVTAVRRVDAGGQAPPADVARPVPGEPGVYAAQLWLMVRGTHSVIVTVEGGSGAGTATVPIVARATAQLAMSRGLGVLLALGGLFLVVGLLTIVGAATREGALAADAAPASSDRRRARFAVATATIVLGLLLFGGWTWVRAEATAHRARIDRPWNVRAAIAVSGGTRVLDLAITDSLWIMRNDPAWLARNGRYRRAELIPDHGKMMHMFVVAEADMAAFAHIHPTRVSDSAFRVPFPPLPPGRYRVFGDIVHADGTAQTLIANVNAPAAPDTGSALVAVPADPGEPPIVLDDDDAWWIGETAQGAVYTLDDGTTVEWLGASAGLASGREAELAFRIRNADGQPALLEPYMGMAGHAMIGRTDGQVFVHLHPSGMISIAAQSALAAEAGNAPDHSQHTAANAPGEVRFPLIGPPPGRYRIWVQVRHAGAVRTAAFDTESR